ADCAGSVLRGRTRQLLRAEPGLSADSANCRAPLPPGRHLLDAGLGDAVLERFAMPEAEDFSVLAQVHFYRMRCGAVDVGVDLGRRAEKPAHRRLFSGHRGGVAAVQLAAYLVCHRWVDRGLFVLTWLRPLGLAAGMGKAGHDRTALLSDHLRLGTGADRRRFGAGDPASAGLG